MPTRVSCPYCNAAVDAPDGPPGRRVACPRCGDSFPVRVAAADDDDAPPSHAPVAPPLDPAFHRPPARRRVPTGRLVAVGGGLTLVGLVAGIALSNRGGGTPDAAPPPPPEVAAVSPTDLAGFALLPADTNLVAGARPGPMLSHAARTGRDPKDVLRAAGVPDAVVAALDRVGVTLPQVDHVVVGAAVGDGPALPRAVAVLALRRPLDDEDRFLRGLAARKETRAGRTVYAVALGGLPATLVKLSPLTWAVATDDKDMPPATGATGPASASLRDLLATRLGPEVAGWAAADEAKWADKPTVRLALASAKRDDALAVLAKGRAAAVGWRFDDPPRVRLVVRAADDAAGDALRAYLRKRAAGDAVVQGGAGEWALVDGPVGGTFERLAGEWTGK